MASASNLASPPPSISGGSGGSSGSGSGTPSVVVSELEELDAKEIELLDVSAMGLRNSVSRKACAISLTVSISDCWPRHLRYSQESYMARQGGRCQDHRRRNGSQSVPG